ncbi:S1 RNA-binding domain-containing protein [Peptococcaceae bacterium]|nr:S1 RNA-binding domain-containing protein [Peptococcaceae bacterium]
MSSSSIEVGKILEGVVSGITKFGAFVNLPGNVRGLVHISEVSSDYVRDVNDFLKVNDRVKVKVLSVDGKGKVGLSIRQAVETSNQRPKKQSKAAIDAAFEDKLSKFLKESDERQQQIKRNTDLKRGGRGASRR